MDEHDKAIEMKDEILIKYLLGEATVEELTLVEGWLKKDSANYEYYLDLKTYWDQSKLLELQPVHDYDTDAQWHKLKLKMGPGTVKSNMAPATTDMNETKAVAKSGRGRIVQVQYWKWAAAIAVFLLGCWLAWNEMQSADNTGNIQILTASASPLTDTLPDGSIVTLNRYSSLQAPLEFKGKAREVTLEDGEAFFNIAHKASKPFLVHIGAIDVKVLGTSFNIKKNGNQTIIDVATGKVSINYKGKQLILHPQERTFIDPSTTELLSQKNQGQLYNYYVTKKFIANNTRLEDLVNILNDAYNQHIVFGRPELKDMRITTVFSKEPLEIILNVISETFGIKVIYNKDSIELK